MIQRDQRLVLPPGRVNARKSTRPQPPEGPGGTALDPMAAVPARSELIAKVRLGPRHGLWVTKPLAPYGVLTVVTDFDSNDTVTVTSRRGVLVLCTISGWDIGFYRVRLGVGYWLAQ